MPLPRYSVGIYQETSSYATRHPCNTRLQSSQLDEPLWTDPGLRSGVSVCELISTFNPPKKRTKKAQAGNELSNIVPKSKHAWKKPPPPLYNNNYNTVLRFATTDYFILHSNYKCSTMHDHFVSVFVILNCSDSSPNRREGEGGGFSERVLFTAFRRISQFFKVVQSGSTWFKSCSAE